MTSHLSIVAAVAAVVSPPAAVTQSGGRGRAVNLQQWRLLWGQLQYLLLWHSNLQGIDDVLCTQHSIGRSYWLSHVLVNCQRIRQMVPALMGRHSGDG